LHLQAIEQMKKRRWEFMGHGITNSKTLANLPLDEERQTIREALHTIEQATGERPRGWLGPGLTETFNTPDLLADEGVQYVGDWNNDDQPYPMKVKQGKLFSVPYCMELNDMNLLNRHAYTGEQYLQALTDQFETLYPESERTALRLPVHNMQMRECIYRRSPTHHRGGVIVQRRWRIAAIIPWSWVATQPHRGILKVSLAMIRLQA
jgi:peptidoglycan/xylan/chitin deacetylase (PgdA/CDA1 family)